MRERVFPDPEQPAVEIPGPVLNEICAHALTTQPEECCGVVVSRGGERFGDVMRCRNDMTAHHRADPVRYPRDGRQAYHMNEADYLRAVTEAEERGDRVTAVYHSHVGADAYFSELDQEFALQPLFPFPDAAQFVVAVWEEKVRAVALFEREAGGEDFRGRQVALGAP